MTPQGPQLLIPHYKQHSDSLDLLVLPTSRFLTRTQYVFDEKRGEYRHVMKSMLVMFVVTQKSTGHQHLDRVPCERLFPASRLFSYVGNQCQLYSGQNSRSSCCTCGLQPLVIYVVVTTRHPIYYMGRQSDTSLKGSWSATDRLQPEHTLATNATNANEICLGSNELCTLKLRLCMPTG